VTETLRDTTGRTYRVESQLARGGQARTLRVTERRSSAPFVAKIFHPEYSNETTRRRIAWLISAELSRRSPALAGPHAEIRRRDGVGYFMPLLPGRSLDEEMAKPTWTLAEGLGIAAAIALALATLEGMGVAHGDLSAANVLLNRDSAGIFRVIVIDPDNFMHPGLPPAPMLGARPFWAPEALRGAAPSVEGDRYSLAVLTHEILYLRHPLSSAVSPDADESAYDAALASVRWFDDPAGDSKTGAPSPGGYPAGILDTPTKRLFRRALVSRCEDRPTAAEWAEVLTRALRRVWECKRCQVQCVNDSSRRSCPNCGHEPPALSLVREGGARISLAGPVTVLGRQNLGGSPVISSTHIVVRRRGLEYGAEDVSTNGSSLLSRRGWERIPKGREVVVGRGRRVRFAGEVEARFV